MKELTPMARPATNHEIRKAEIVAAALKSFAAYGYEGTSNKTIAQQGGFKSPALIYHYFPGGKPELFQACLDEFQPLRDFQQLMEGDFELPIEEFLREAGLNYLKMVSDETVRSVIRLVMTEAPRFPELGDILPRRLVPLLVQPTLFYLVRYSSQHTLPVNQPMALVLQFFGPLFARTLLRIAGANETLVMVPFPTDEELVETLVKTFLHGFLNQPGEGAGSKE